MSIAKQTAKEILTAAVAAKSINELKAAARLLMTDYSDGAGVAFAFVLNELEDRLTPEAYEAFCDSL